MKIPSDRLDEIRQRHEAGQSDPQIAVWLAGLLPPIYVTPDAIRKARGRSAAKSADKPETSAKPSGAVNRKRKAVERDKEARDHAERGGVVLDTPFDGNPMRAHLYELTLLLELQRKVAFDEVMTLPDKVRFCTQIGQTIAKLRVDAEIELEQEEIRRERAKELAEMQQLEQELEREKKALATLRRQLEQQLGERN